MLSRRQFLRASGTAALAATFRDDSQARAMAAGAAVQNDSAGAVASNEDYWREIQQAFTLDRTIINLNNGGCCPSPRVVHEAFKRYLDISNQAPVYHMWQMLEPNIETRAAAAGGGVRLRSRGARHHAQRERGAADRPARASTSRPGDEVVTTNQDYGRMLDTWEQRVRRDGIKLTKVSFPVPPRSHDELADRLLGAITPATKVLHFCHITNLTGQIFPVKRICDEARRRGVKTIVDGAHAFAHFPYKAADLGCDYYGTSLHKWLLAPIGTGFLYVRREHIPTLWPLTPAAAAKNDDIRKFEEIGTHPAANHNAIAEALAFHEGIGIERKAARLRYLRDRWATRLAAHPKSADPHQARSGALVRDRHRSDHRRADAQSHRAAVGHAGASSPRRSSTPSTKARGSRRTSTRRSKRSTRLRKRWSRSPRRARISGRMKTSACQGRRQKGKGERLLSKIEGESDSPHRPTIGRQEAREEASVVVLVLIVVVSEVEEGEPVVPVQAGMRTHPQLRSDARVPTEFAGRFGGQGLVASQKLDPGRVPATTPEHVRAKRRCGRDRAAATPGSASDAPARFR